MNSTILSSRAGTIPAPIDATSLNGKATWDLVCQMEDPIWTMHDILTAIGIMVIEMEGDKAVAAVQRLVNIAQKSFEKAEELRGQIFHLNHPRREELSREASR